MDVQTKIVALAALLFLILWVLCYVASTKLKAGTVIPTSGYVTCVLYILLSCAFGACMCYFKVVAVAYAIIGFSVLNAFNYIFRKY